MSNGILHGKTGGAGLAVKVVGGTQRPSNGKQGIIWVNTYQKITSWTIQAEEPTEPAEGMVWVGILTSATLNALKKNGIWFTPTSAKQYTDGAWTERIGEYYKNNEWFPIFSASFRIKYWPGYECSVAYDGEFLTAPDTSGTWDLEVGKAGTLTITATYGDDVVTREVEITEQKEYDFSVCYVHYHGKPLSSITGGWQGLGRKYGSSGSENVCGMIAPNVTTNSDHVVITQPWYGSSHNFAGSLYITNNKIDLSNFSSLKLEGTMIACASWIGLMGVWTAISDTYTHDYLAAKVDPSSETDSSPYYITSSTPLSISEISSSCYIGFALRHASADSPEIKVTMYSLLLE